MSKIKGFLEINRQLPLPREVRNRLADFKEVEGEVDTSISIKQATRCMDCGIPFCHQGCPLGNIIPDFNEALYNENWQEAYNILSSTNNFPEFTGRLCPAPCETSCVLGINKAPVAIEYIEKSIVETAFEKGYITPQIPKYRTGKRVAVIGSGPAGLAVADQLNKAGHWVTVFERAEKLGGLLRFGIPDFKLEKGILDRRLGLMVAEEIIFKTGCNIGTNIPTQSLLDSFDAIVLCCGSTVPRDLNIEGRKLSGVHFAMDFLTQQNRRVSALEVSEEEITANGKHVVVIGGGDTGSDCVGTSNRQGALSVTQIEILPKPPDKRHTSTPWPQWPLMMRTSSSHVEGCQREWSIMSKRFVSDEKGVVKAIEIVDIVWQDGKANFLELPETRRQIPCDLALLALGFLHPQHTGLLDNLGVEYDKRGNVIGRDYHTSLEKVFCAGDVRRGQSLIVWAISEGREAARAVDEFLMGISYLPQKATGGLSSNKQM